MNNQDKIKQFLSRLEIEFPLLQAPMAGGIITPALVSSVANAGCLGSLASGYLNAAQLEQLILETEKLTTKPFAVNLFIPAPYDIDQNKVATMLKKLNIYRIKTGLCEVNDCKIPNDELASQLDVILSHKIKIVSFTFGLLDKAAIHSLKSNGVYLIGTATRVAEGLALEAAGCDAIVAQGYEAGGHRGTFLGEASSALMGLMALIPALYRAVKIPVIAAGGIMDGQGVAACLLLGAVGVQLGTAFLTCQESGASNTYRKLLAQSDGSQTCLTKCLSGKLARGIVTKLIKELEELSIPDYPIQHYLTSDIRKAASAQNQIDFITPWAGQGLKASHQLFTAAEIINKIKEEFNQIAKIHFDF
ncbi:MAG: hypothetical protein A3E87_02620 [Gammaproteobacteria bacterium RIFCSPHIGHO2_12_FULL_35_23]|nr:MAG: hypothetical protein A3E87_02620 [Gammaproteobacteria bacterium RIFCSPHIGHO2_12_FULL_35_23]